jgi:DNA-dependent RNA polymerase auxiliary subunit epsilon
MSDGRIKKGDNDWFAHARRSNIAAVGLEAFKRENVFGTKQGAEYPIADLDYLHCVFGKLALSFGVTKNTDIIRLAAWTYRCGAKEFQCIIDYVMRKVKQCAAGNFVPIPLVEMTVCANMLSISEQREFLCCFTAYLAPKVADCEKKRHIIPIQKIDHWVRALMWILIYSNGLLETISSEECEECMRNLYIVWINYNRHKTCHKQAQYVRNVICCMLFLLRRRKYDRSFLRENTSELFVKIMGKEKKNDKSDVSIVEVYGQRQFIKDYKYKLSSTITDIASAFFEYMENHGSLNIPLGGILDDNGGDGND